LDINYLAGYLHAWYVLIRNMAHAVPRTQLLNGTLEIKMNGTHGYWIYFVSSFLYARYLFSYSCSEDKQFCCFMSLSKGSLPQFACSVHRCFVWHCFTLILVPNLITLGYIGSKCYVYIHIIWKIIFCLMLYFILTLVYDCLHCKIWIEYSNIWYFD
jgi:hypothetical protein